MSERLAQLLLLGALMLLPVKGAQAETPEAPIYVKTSNGWNASYAHGNGYAEFRVIGNSAKLQDPYHILLRKDVGMMVPLSQHQATVKNIGKSKTEVDE